MGNAWTPAMRSNMQGAPRRPSVLGVAVAALAATIACGGDPDSPSPATASKISIAPTSLALKVGARGSLTASVKNSSGAVISNASVTWVSRGPQVATIDNSGNVSALAAGATTVVATSGRVADSVSITVTRDLLLGVEPNAASVRVAETHQFGVTAKNSLGQTVSPPAVTWRSSSPQVATVSATGVATGVAKGTTSITATGDGVTSTPATLTVLEGCNSMVNASTFVATLDYDWVSQGTTDRGVAVAAAYRGRLSATLTKQARTAREASWTGDITGIASVMETRQDPATPDATTTLQADGTVRPLSGALAPKMTLRMDLQECTYQIDAMVTLNALRTEPNRAASRSDIAVASLHARTRPLGTGVAIVLENAPFDTHSQTWSAANLDKDAFMPLGLAVERTGRSATEQAVGRATVLWVLHPE